MFFFLIPWYFSFTFFSSSFQCLAKTSKHDSQLILYLHPQQSNPVSWISYMHTNNKFASQTMTFLPTPESYLLPNQYLHTDVNRQLKTELLNSSSKSSPSQILYFCLISFSPFLWSLSPRTLKLFFTPFYFSYI